MTRGARFCLSEASVLLASLYVNGNIFIPELGFCYQQCAGQIHKTRKERQT